MGARYKDRVFTAMPIATAPWHSAQNIAFHEVGRQAVMADPDWLRRRLLRQAQRPSRGLAVARMAAHITYLSEKALQDKFGRSLQDRDQHSFSFDADFQVESYLRHQGSTFVDRFDANSYLYITRAMDYFDLAAEYGGAGQRVHVAPRRGSASSPSPATGSIPRAKIKRSCMRSMRVAANVSFVEIESDKGHDAFLLDEPDFFDTMRGFLNAAAKKRGIA